MKSVAEQVWLEALADPAFKAALDEGLADVAAGRTVPYPAQPRVTPTEPDPERLAEPPDPAIWEGLPASRWTTQPVPEDPA